MCNHEQCRGRTTKADEKFQKTLNSIPVLGTKTLPPPTRYRDGYKSRYRRSCKTLSRNSQLAQLRRSKSEPYSAYAHLLLDPARDGSDTPSASVSPVSTLTPSTASHSPTPFNPARPFTPARPQYLDINKFSVNKKDRGQQTPQDDVDLTKVLPPPPDLFVSTSFQSKNLKEMELRFVDESSAVLPSPSPDCGDESSGMSTSDFHMKTTPTHARQESDHQDSMQSSSCQSSPPPDPMTRLPSYLYGRPLPVFAAPPVAPLKNTSFPVLEELKGGKPHHDHYLHHTHFQQDLGLPHFSDLSKDSSSFTGQTEPKLPTIYAGDSPFGSSSIMSSSTSECGECCGGHAPFPPAPVDPSAPVIIPATMCKGTQISPTSVIEMYSASLSRKTNEIPPPPKRPAPNLTNGRLMPGGEDADISSQSSSSGAAAVRFGNPEEIPPCPKMALLDPLSKVQKTLQDVQKQAPQSANEAIECRTKHNGDAFNEIEKIEDNEETKGDQFKDKVSSFDPDESNKNESEALMRKIGKRIRFRKRRKRDQKEKKTENRAKKALKTISLILGAFVTCWTPFHIFAIIASFCPSCINVHVYMFSYFLCYANSPINPFCYAASNQQFKSAFKRIMRGDLSMK